MPPQAARAGAKARSTSAGRAMHSGHGTSSAQSKRVAASGAVNAMVASQASSRKVKLSCK
jgi:hypothetical protein